MIYFIQQGTSGPVKIGYARTRRGVRVRLDTFQTAHVEPLRLLGVVRGDRDDERLLHEAFADQRLRGEWFAPCGDIFACVAPGSHAVQEWVDCQFSMQRWRRLGLLAVDGSITDRMVWYLTTCERQLSEDGCDLDDFAEALRDWEAEADVA